MLDGIVDNCNFGTDLVFACSRDGGNECAVCDACVRAVRTDDSLVRGSAPWRTCSCANDGCGSIASDGGSSVAGESVRGNFLLFALICSLFLRI